MRLTVYKNGFFGNKVILDTTIPYSISPDSWYRRSTCYLSQAMDVDKIIFSMLRSKNIDLSRLKFARSEGDDLICKYTLVDSKNKIKYTVNLIPGSEWRFMSDYVEFRKGDRIAKGKREILESLFWAYGYDDQDNLLDKIEIVINDGTHHFKRIEELNDQIHFTYSNRMYLGNMVKYVDDNYPSDQGADAADRKLFMAIAYESVTSKQFAKLKVIGNEDDKIKLSVTLGGKYKAFCLDYIRNDEDAQKSLSKTHEEILTDLGKDAISSIDGKTLPISFYIVQENGNLIPMKNIGQKLMNHNNFIVNSLNEWEQKRIKATRGSQKDKKEYYNYLEQMLGESWKNLMKYWGYGAEIGEPCVPGYIKDEKQFRYIHITPTETELFEAEENARRKFTDEDLFNKILADEQKIEDEEWTNNYLQDLD